MEGGESSNRNDAPATENHGEPLKDALANGSKSPKSAQRRSLDAPLRSGDAKKGDEEIGPPTNASAPPPKLEAGTLPDFIVNRNELFGKLKRQWDEELQQRERVEIQVSLNLGFDKEGKARPPVSMTGKTWESTPGSFLKHVDKGVSVDVVVARVNGKELWDLDRPLEYSCQISYIPFSSSEGRNVFWHSSAHVLGEASECQFNCLLSHGPPVEQGFFYDMAIEGG